MVRCGANSVKQARHQGLKRSEHIVLRDEAHLDIELVELAGRAVGAGVFVAVAGRNLEVAIEAGHHDDLLEHLRRLRQRVELTRMAARREPENRARLPDSMP